MTQTLFWAQASYFAAVLEKVYQEITIRCAQTAQNCNNALTLQICAVELQWKCI